MTVRLLTYHTLCTITALFFPFRPLAEPVEPRVEVLELEDVFTFEYPNNGSGPLWCYGSTQIARIGDDVFVSEQHTNRAIEPYCNTRWRLLHRQNTGEWKCIAAPEGFRQREPCPLAVVGDNLFLNVNDSLTPAGTKGDVCEPYILRFSTKPTSGHAQKLSPAWSGSPHFTDHSYRGYATDSERRELLMLNTGKRTNPENGETIKGQNWCYMTEDGETLTEGLIEFPLFAAYPQVALTRGAAYVMAISDVVEPNETWRAYKKEQTGYEWDYVFRELYFTWNPELKTQPFSKPIVVAQVHETGGHITNQDLWISPHHEAYLLYTQRTVQSALLRDRFFPDLSILNALKLAIITDGKIVETRDLLVGSEDRDPQHARFHQTPDGKLYAIVYTDGAPRANFIMQVYPQTETPPLISVPFKKPFSSFCSASIRTGNQPSYLVDLFGDNQGGYAQNFTQDRSLSYACLRIIPTSE